MFLMHKTTQPRSNEFRNIKPVYFEDAQLTTVTHLLR